MTTMKCIVFGAGASAFCDIANPDRRPPLVKVEDFSRIVTNPLDYSLPSSPYGEGALNPFFSWAFDYFSDDIEQLFTVLYLLSKERSFEGIEEQLRKKYNEEPWLEGALLLASKSRPLITPRNPLTMVTALVTEEIMYCLGTSGPRPQRPQNQPLSEDHRKLVRTLRSGDAVVSFNYDTVADYALLNERLLNSKSFRNSYLNPIRIPESHEAQGEPVLFCKPHGSINWFSPLSDAERIGVFFGRLFENTDFSTPAPVILPYHAKDIILEDLPAFKNELRLSLEAIGASDELILFGKQFQNRDLDLCNGIRNACQQKKRFVIYIDPQSSNSDWVSHHDTLFNAANLESPKRLYQNLSSFLQDCAVS